MNEPARGTNKAAESTGERVGVRRTTEKRGVRNGREWGKRFGWRAATGGWLANPVVVLALACLLACLKALPASACLPACLLACFLAHQLPRFYLVASCLVSPRRAFASASLSPFLTLSLWTAAQEPPRPGQTQTQRVGTTSSHSSSSHPSCSIPSSFNPSISVVSRNLGTMGDVAANYVIHESNVFLRTRRCMNDFYQGGGFHWILSISKETGLCDDFERPTQFL